LESPWAGNIERNKIYAFNAMRDSLGRGEAPFASHLLYTLMLNDDVPVERRIGIAAGLSWGVVAEATVVYTDYGITAGMQQGIDRAHAEGRPVEERRLWAERSLPEAS
jgi:hypothetical protein